MEESVEQEHYSITITFSHDVIIESVAGLDSQESCLFNNTQYTKVAKTVCTKLNSNTLYTLLFHGMVTLMDDGPIPLKFIVNFMTKISPNEEVTGKMVTIQFICHLTMKICAKMHIRVLDFCWVSSL